MIVINKTNPTQAILLTLDGVQNHSELLVQSDASRKEYEIALGENASLFDRYDLFSVDTSVFNDMPEGYYSYEVKDLDTGELIESGKLYIIPDDPEPTIPVVTVTSNETLIFTK